MTAAYESTEPQHTAGYLWSVVLRLLPPPPARLLEAGCGNGAFARTLLDLGYAIAAFDASTSGVRVAQAELGVNAIVLRIGDAPPPAWEAAFDAVVGLEVIEHLYEPGLLARMAHWALKPEGMCAISTPYHGYLKYLAIAALGRGPRHFDPLWDGGHVKFFTPASLRLLLGREGLTDVRFRFAGGLPWLWKSMVATARKPESR